MNLSRFFQLMILLTLVGIVSSCETKEYENQHVTAFSGELNDSSFFSELDFAGLNSITDVSDTTVNVNWTEVNSAKEYYVYEVDNGSPRLITRVSAPASTYRVEGLLSGRIYSYQVRVRDNKDLLDDNEIILSTATLSKPKAPYFIYRLNPLKINGVIRKPSIMIFGVNAGDTVKLYTDACVTQVGEGVATDTNISIVSEELAPDITYNFYARRTNVNLVDSSCSIVSTSYNLDTCPNGYIKIPENRDLGVKEFCVMKYEAKPWSDSDGDNIVDTAELNYTGCKETSCTTENWGRNSYYPGSNSSGAPWRMLDMENAKEECQSLGDNYDLISNVEWMSIAENVETQNINWSGAIIGNGCLFRGNNGISDACGYNFGNINYGIGRNSKASMGLSNGETIWDFSGNVAEWTDWGKDKLLTKSPMSCDDNWGEIDENFCNGEMDLTEYMPKNPLGLANWNSSYGLGQIEGGAGGYAVRGGSFQYLSYAGAYSLSFAQTKTTVSKNTGFRCVYRTPENL